MSEDTGVQQLGATGLDRPSIESLKTPGAWLRHYREEREVSLEELAAVLKITVGKLEALERDDYSQLPDMVFTRALSNSICRLLGFDPAPVMALFPAANSPRLARDADGLNQPFKPSTLPAPTAPAERAGIPGSAVALVVVAALVGAAVYFWPQIEQFMGWSDPVLEENLAPTSGRPGVTEQVVSIPGLTQPPGALQPAPAPAPEVPEPAQEEDAAPEASSPAADASTPPSAEVSTDPAAAPAPETIRIQAQEPVWIQIRDASNAILHQSTLPKGREIAITNNPPLRVEIGRANAVKVTVKGQDFDVKPFVRGNVARFEVQP